MQSCIKTPDVTEARKFRLHEKGVETGHHASIQNPAEVNPTITTGTMTDTTTAIGTTPVIDQDQEAQAVQSIVLITETINYLIIPLKYNSVLVSYLTFNYLAAYCKISFHVYQLSIGGIGNYFHDISHVM